MVRIAVFVVYYDRVILRGNDDASGGINHTQFVILYHISKGRHKKVIAAIVLHRDGAAVCLQVSARVFLFENGSMFEFEISNLRVFGFQQDAIINTYYATAC